MNPIKNIIRWFCTGFMPLYFGGDTASTTQQTTQNYDQRQVNTTSTTIADLSNRSIRDSNNTTNADLSNRSIKDAWNTTNSTTNADLSNRSTNNTNTYTSTMNSDYGSISAALNFAGKSSDNNLGALMGGYTLADKLADKNLNGLNNGYGLASKISDISAAGQVHAYDYADQLFSGALDFANQNSAREMTAFDRAARIQNDALATVSGAAASSISTLKSAYSDAKGTTQSQQQIIFAVLAVAGIFALSSMRH
jgi:hypothetical protein